MDVYKKLASQMFNISENEVTPEQRRLAKRAGFSMIYTNTEERSTNGNNESSFDRSDLQDN